jgi:hypothetical protein
MRFFPALLAMPLLGARPAAAAVGPALTSGLPRIDPKPPQGLQQLFAPSDGDNVWPFVERDDKPHYDGSKLDPWGTVFDHATERGLYLHFKLQENELDDNRPGDRTKRGVVPPPVRRQKSRNLHGE